jgi:nucleotide-binding universal stress UspA family protein
VIKSYCLQVKISVNQNEQTIKFVEVQFVLARWQQQFAQLYRKELTVARGQKKSKLIMKILVPTDGSVEAQEAGRYAAELAQALGAKVTLLNVVQLPRLPARFLEMADEALKRELFDTGKGILESARQSFADVGVPVTIELREGRPADVIMLTAVQGKFDLIVMGSRGLDPSESILLGGVSDQVIRHARCPVLIVRAKYNPAAA